MSSINAIPDAQSGSLIASGDNTATLLFQVNGNNLISINSSQLVNCTADTAVVLPSGTTAQRPTGVNGMIRYNSNTAVIEAYVNSTWTSITT
jgi:hypothetical protein